MLFNDIIEPSSSPYNSPVWIVPKKPDPQTGKSRWRMVIDYRKLNEKTINDAYPLPLITDILDQLGSAKYFSVLDMASGFHQIELDENSRQKSAFSCGNGLYQFKRMPFGLKTAPATFQRLMNIVLSGLNGVEMFVFMDDVIIYANSLSEHEQKLRKFLERIKVAGLTLQPEKCKFLRREIIYLGHLITDEGVRPDPMKVKAVRDFPVPRTKKNILEFLGLAGYYRRFVKDFAEVSMPLVRTLKKAAHFHWSEESQKAFGDLKDILCSEERLLKYPDFSRPFVVTCDASNNAVGAVLSQEEIGKDPPIAYASRILKGPEIVYDIFHGELVIHCFLNKKIIQINNKVD